MENNFVDVQILFDKTPADYDISETITGTVQLTVERNLSFEYLKIENIFRIHGTQETFLYPQNNVILAQNGIWEVGEIYTYSFKLAGGILPTYKGRNIKTNWYLNATFLLTEDSIQDLDIDNYRKNPPLIQRVKKTFIAHFELKNSSKKLNFAVNEEKVFSDNLFYWSFLLIGLIMLYFILFGVNMSGNAYVTLTVFTLICFSVFGIYIQKYYYFRKLKLRFAQKKPEHLQVQILLNSKLSSFKDARFGYRILEEIKVDTDDGKSTLRKDAFEYLHPDRLVENDGVITVEMPVFNTYPPSFSRKNHELRWVLFFEMEGFFSTFTKEIPLTVSYNISKLKM